MPAEARGAGGCIEGFSLAYFDEANLPLTNHPSIQFFHYVQKSLREDGIENRKCLVGNQKGKRIYYEEENPIYEA